MPGREHRHVDDGAARATTGDDVSVPELIGHLAHETGVLVQLELASFRRELGEQGRRTSWIGVSTYVLIVGIALALLFFAVGGVIALERVTGDYAVAALLTGSGLLAIAVAAFLKLRRIAARVADDGDST